MTEIFRIHGLRRSDTACSTIKLLHVEGKTKEGLDFGFQGEEHRGDSGRTEEYPSVLYFYQAFRNNQKLGCRAPKEVPLLHLLYRMSSSLAGDAEIKALGIGSGAPPRHLTNFCVDFFFWTITGNPLRLYEFSFSPKCHPLFAKARGNHVL